MTKRLNYDLPKIAGFSCLRSRFFAEGKSLLFLLPLSLYCYNMADGSVMHVPTASSLQVGTIPTKALFIWRKVVPGKRVTLLAESTLPSVYMRKKLTPLPEPRAEHRARACSECLALRKLTRLGELKCLYGEKLARLGG